MRRSGRGREQELRATFAEIATAADILVGNEEDFQLALGIAGPEAGGGDVASKIDSFKEMIGRVGEAYPNASYFANTLREVIDANRHMWGALIFADGAFHVAEPREIGVLDRIFGEEGARILHLTGVIAALSPAASRFCLDVARAAKRHGARISFDLNYRASFWEGPRAGASRDLRRDRDRRRHPGRQ